jgi:glyoxylase-like metal-dependent hydrolase (beta-lactamase superfamily II)
MSSDSPTPPSLGSTPVADRWFQRRSLGDGITWITEPHAHPLIRCNVWHVRGRDRDLLVDTGLGLASLREEIADLCEHPLTAVATHVHYDHAGSLHEFEDRRIHRLEQDKMADYHEFAWIRRDDFPPFILEGLAEFGYPIEDELLIDALPTSDFDPAAYAIQSTQASALEEGDVLDLGDRHFEVLHLPGHTPGSLGLWEAASETLFSGDAIYDGPLLDDLPESDLIAYVATMKRLRELPVRVVHGGHEPSFGRERMIEIVDAYLEARG